MNGFPSVRIPGADRQLTYKGAEVRGARGGGGRAPAHHLLPSSCALMKSAPALSAQGCKERNGFGGSRRQRIVRINVYAS